MKSISYLLVIVVFTLFCSCNKAKLNDSKGKDMSIQKQEFYQLKTYIFDTDSQVLVTEQYLKNAFLPALGRLGIENVGVFKPRMDANDTIKKVFVLIPFSSLDQMLQIDVLLAADESYLTAGNEYLSATYDKKPYSRIETVLMKAFEDWPVLKTPELDGPRSERVYELRSYESATEAIAANKREMFNAGGEINIFNELGCNPVFFGEVISGAHMPNLMYLTTYANQQSRDDHWKAFGESAAWDALKNNPKYQNNVSHIDISFLYPTEYSNY